VTPGDDPLELRSVSTGRILGAPCVTVRPRPAPLNGWAATLRFVAPWLALGLLIGAGIVAVIVARVG
jgi:hypothetical protein